MAGSMSHPHIALGTYTAKRVCYQRHTNKHVPGSATTVKEYRREDQAGSAPIEGLLNNLCCFVGMTVTVARPRSRC